MAATLQEILLAPDTQPRVIDDCYSLLEQEIADKSGISGTAVKLAHKTVNAVLPGHIRIMIGKLLPDMTRKLEPYWTDFTTSGSGEFGDYLSKRGDEVSQSLLVVTDERARRSGRAVVVRAYNSVRDSGARHVEAALPRVGALVHKYAG